MFSYGPLHMAEQKQDDQLEHTYSNSVRIRDVALRTFQKWWTIRKSGERGSGVSVLAAQHDDDDDSRYRIWQLQTGANILFSEFLYLQWISKWICYSIHRCIFYSPDKTGKVSSFSELLLLYLSFLYFFSSIKSSLSWSSCRLAQIPLTISHAIRPYFQLNKIFCRSANTGMSLCWNSGENITYEFIFTFPPAASLIARQTSLVCVMGSKWTHSRFLFV